MPSSETSPQLLLVYTLAILYTELPRVTAYLHIPIAASLVSHLLISGCFFTSTACLIIDTCYTFTRLGFMLLGWILRGSDFDLERFQQWKPPGSDNSRFWFKVTVSVIIGCTLTAKLFFFNKTQKAGNDGIWRTAKRNIEQKRNTQSLARTDKADTAESIDTESVLWWAYCAFAYTNALFDSKEWFESMFMGSSQTERTRPWDMWCLWGPSLISAAVGSGRWRWMIGTKERKAQPEEKPGDEKVSEKQQV